MANGHGGYRKPSNPAPVSGPGQYSKRTDGQVVSTMSGQDYGQAGQDHANESLQPMGATKPAPTAPVAPGGPQSAPSAPQYMGGEFGGPTSRPGEPVTAGAPSGPGPGMEALGGATAEGPMSMPTGYITNTIKQLAATDTTGLLGELYLMAQQRGV